MRRRVALLVFVAMAVAWAIAILAAPVTTYLATVVYAIGSLVCHQLPERSFHLAGSQLPVCARCAGLYIGGAAGGVAWSVRSRRRLSPSRARRVLVVVALPTAATGLLAALGWWDLNNALRAVLAAPLGLTVGVLAAAVVAGDLK